MSKLKMIGAVISTPPHGFMTWSGTTWILLCYESFTFWRLLKVINVFVARGVGSRFIWNSVVCCLVSLPILI